MNRRDVCIAGLALPFFAVPSLAAGRAWPDLATIDRGRVLNAANRYLSETPVTITAFRAPRSPGGANDYYSEADYWWPDPANPTAPYIRKDGFSNPAKFVAHREAMIRLSVQLPALVAAWRLTGDDRYGRHAARHLDAWFVTPATRMKPHLDHAQAIIGVNTGRGIGVIDTLHLVEVARAIGVLELRGFRYSGLPAVKRWFSDYLRWLTTSKNGTDEREEKNNHGSCWLLQATQFALLLGDGAVVADARKRFKTVIMPQQILPDGRQPLELARTKPYSYSLFNLDVLATAAHSLSTPQDPLWRFETSDGRGIAAALAFMAPFIADKARWPYPPDVEYFDDLPVRQVSLLFGGRALDRPDYLDLWQRLDPDPAAGEIIRNFPIRQPLLWVD